MKRALLSLVAVVAACSSDRATATDVQAPITNVSVTGPLKLTVTDFPSAPGILFVRPTASTSPSTISVQSTRYGSLCIYDVNGAAQVDGRSVLIRVTFSERLTVCTADIRALKYVADLTIPRGSYDLRVVHEENGQADTVIAQTVTVP